jgi:hypothetical protein
LAMTPRASKARIGVSTSHRKAQGKDPAALPAPIDGAVNAAARVRESIHKQADSMFSHGSLSN